jgi:hypothetical protein
MSHHLSNMCKRTFEDFLIGIAKDEYQKAVAIFKISAKKHKAKEGEYDSLNAYISHKK